MANGIKMGNENEVKSVRVCVCMGDSVCVCVYSYLVDELLLILFMVVVAGDVAVICN